MLTLEPVLAQKTHIIWDWNGTLLNDAHLCREIMSEQLELYGLEPLTLERHRKHFRMPVRHYYEAVGFDLERLDFDALAQYFVRNYAERARQACRLWEGAEDLLSRLKAAGKRQAILSASEQTHLHEMVEHAGIRDYFDAVFGLSDIYARSKVDRGRELLEHWQAPPENCVLVGDMDHDLEVGEALGIDVLLLGDGHQEHQGPALSHPYRVDCRRTGAVLAFPPASE